MPMVTVDTPVYSETITSRISFDEYVTSVTAFSENITQSLSAEDFAEIIITYEGSV